RGRRRRRRRCGGYRATGADGVEVLQQRTHAVLGRQVTRELDEDLVERRHRLRIRDRDVQLAVLIALDGARDDVAQLLRRRRQHQRRRRRQQQLLRRHRQARGLRETGEDVGDV